MTLWKSRTRVRQRLSKLEVELGRRWPHVGCCGFLRTVKPESLGDIYVLEPNCFFVPAGRSFIQLCSNTRLNLFNLLENLQLLPSCGSPPLLRMQRLLLRRGWPPVVSSEYRSLAPSLRAMHQTYNFNAPRRLFGIPPALRSFSLPVLTA